MDYVTIDQLRLQSVHGHHEHERHIEQEFVVSLKIGFDSHSAGESDELKDTIDFDTLRTIIEEIFKSKSRYLVEALAEEIAGRVLKETSAREATISIQKTAVWPDAVPGIVITRSR